MDPAIRQSLQEIAGLLLLLHDYYLKDIFGNDILISLMVLLRDVGLAERVSLLDAERLRRSAMGSGEGDMGYELFYDWLRGVSQLVHKEYDATGKKALHFLLTRYIVPFASQLHTHFETRSIQLPCYSDAALSVIVDYDDFILHWFCETLTQRPARALGANAGLWSQISDRGGQLDFLGILGSATKYNLVPDLITEDDLESIMLRVAGGGDGGEGGESVSLPAFLHLLELVSESMREADVHTDTHTDAHGAPQSAQLLFLMRFLLHHVLQRTTFRFLSRSGEEARAGVKAVGVGAEGAGAGTDGAGTGAGVEEVSVFDETAIGVGSVTDETIVWWLRQAGLLCEPLAQLPLLYALLGAFAETHPDACRETGTDTWTGSGTGRLWLALRVPEVLCNMVGALANQSVLLTLGPGLSHPEALIYLARTCPALFFAQPAVSAPVRPLRLLYGEGAALLLGAVGATGTGTGTGTGEELRAAVDAWWAAMCPPTSPVSSSPYRPFRAQGSAGFSSIGDGGGGGGGHGGGVPCVQLGAVLDFCREKRLLPAVLSVQAFMGILRSVLGEDGDGDEGIYADLDGGDRGRGRDRGRGDRDRSRGTGDVGATGTEIVVSQARLVETFFLIAQQYGPLLENLRLRRGVSADPPKSLKSKRSFRTFLYLMQFEFTFSVVVSVAADPKNYQRREAQVMEVKGKGTSASRGPVEGIPVGGGAGGAVARAMGAAQMQVQAQMRSYSPHSQDRDSPMSEDTLHEGEQPLQLDILPQSQSPQSQSPLAQSAHAQSALVQSQAPELTESPRPHSDDLAPQGWAQMPLIPLRSEHPLIDVAVLLSHYPLCSFSLNPWQIMKLLAMEVAEPSTSTSTATVTSNTSTAGAGAGTGTGAGAVATADSSLTGLLRRFSGAYQVSSEQLSDFFSAFYLPDKDDTRSGAKQRALRSPVMARLVDKSTLKLLFLNHELLRWEYARCVRYRPINPFTHEVTLPISSDTQASLLSPASALLWAAQVAKLSEGRARHHLAALACLSGQPALTFSTFTLFAVRCFSDALFTAGGAGEGACDMDGGDGTVTCSERQFLDAVRCMLHAFSLHLSRVQQALRMKVLRPLFGAEDLAREPDTSDVSAIIAAATAIFNHALAAATPIAPTSLALAPAPRPPTPGDGRIPPRPPRAIWDAARFAHFVRDLGLAERFDWSVQLAWVAFAVLLRECAPPGADAWEAGVVSPIPVKAGPDTTRQLLETLLWVAQRMSSAGGVGGGAGGGVGADTGADAGADAGAGADSPDLIALYYKALTPVICAHTDLKDAEGGGNGGNSGSVRGSLASSGAEQGRRDLRLEDLLRYGGSLAMTSLGEAQGALRRAYGAILLGAPGRMGPSSRPVGDRDGDGSRERDRGEVPLNLLCRFLSCGELLRPSAVALQAKRSLHARLRPVPCSGPEVATLSFAEFEELCLRCGFLLWHTSGALDSPEQQPSKAALMAQAHLRPQGQGQQASVASAQRAAEHYASYCEEAAQHRAIQRAQAGAGGRKRAWWGVDFLLPYLNLLLSNTLYGNNARFGSASASNGSNFTDSSSGTGATNPLSLLGLLRTNTPASASASTVNAVSTVSAASAPTAAQLLAGQGPARGRASAAPAAPAPIPSTTSTTAAATPEGEGLSDILSLRLNYSIADPALRRAEARAARTGGVVGGVGGGRGVAGVGSPTKLHTRQELSLSSSERFQLLQESSEQFVVALDELLVGTKEALWPVYATYCSCGDSLDPGKLSGPNLFTLLSKLGVLTDRTLLSDAGILLHQTAVHSLASSPQEAVATLHQEGGEYFQSPSLTFEEFIVFLCAFSHLRFDGVMVTSEMFQKSLSRLSRHSTQDNWFRQWQQFMGSSGPFRRLLGECVLPILQGRTLLAVPEHARFRDRFCCVFSLDVLLAIEGAEGPMQAFFEREQERARWGSSSSGGQSSGGQSSGGQSSSSVGNSGGGSGGGGRGVGRGEAGVGAIVTALRRVNLIPGVMEEAEVLRLIRDSVRDVLPEESRRKRGASTFTSASVSASMDSPGIGGALLFPQWEWVLSVVACHAVQTAVLQSAVYTDPQKIPSLVADVIASIATAISKEL